MTLVNIYLIMFSETIELVLAKGLFGILIIHLLIISGLVPPLITNNIFLTFVIRFFFYQFLHLCL